MSMVLARDILNNMNMREAFISPAFAQSVVFDLQQLAAANPKTEMEKFEERKLDQLAAYGFGRTQNSKPFAFADGVAIIPVHGTLINRFGQSWGSVTGYNFIASQMNAALADEDVEAIIFDCNSYGGEAAGCFELSDAIFAARGDKPLWAVIDSNSYSACYAIASACDKVVLTPSGGAGSIGVVAMHVSLEKLLEENGVKISFVYAGAHKVDGNPFQDLPDDVRADIQSGVDKSYAKFTSTVARNRGLDDKAVRDTEARTYRADDALNLGLIDAIATPTEAVNALFTELSGSDNQENDMDPKDKAEGSDKPKVDADANVVTTTAAEAATAERARIEGITGCEEAKGNPALANHFAFKTDMSVDQAKEALKAAGPAAPKEDANKDDKDPFRERMDKDKHPDLGADDEGKPTEQSTAARVLALQKGATGAGK